MIMYLTRANNIREQKKSSLTVRTKTVVLRQYITIVGWPIAFFFIYLYIYKCNNFVYAQPVVIVRNDLS